MNFIQSARRGVLAALLLALAGCHGMVKSSVQAFAGADAPRTGERVVVVPTAQPDQETLEHRAWVTITEQELTKRGFVVVKPGQQADLVAVVGLALAGSRNVTRSYAIPQYGVTGYSGSNTLGTISRTGNFATYQGTTTYTPQYGVTGYSTGLTSQREHSRVGILAFYRPRSPTPQQAVFEARAVSDGSCALLGAVAPPMIEALFDRFPQGGTGSVTRPLQSGC
jgi:hypothetical protein